MSAQNAIDFCPAAACSADLARLEALGEITAQLMTLAAQTPNCLPLMRGLEAILEDLMLACEEARGRLADINAVSAAGAIAQLLGAIRDIRVGDEPEKRRARTLEARAIHFVEMAGLFGADVCCRLSQTRTDAAPYPASREISASESS